MIHVYEHSPIDRPMTYQIKVKGKLDESWSDWLEGMAVMYESGNDGTGVTTLTGVVKDQAALHGILNRIRDLNILLLSVQRIPPEIDGEIIP